MNQNMFTLRIREDTFSLGADPKISGFFYHIRDQNEPHREKKYLLTCAPNEDSKQPAHPRFAEFLAIQNAPNEDSDQTRRMHRLI